MKFPKDLRYATKAWLLGILISPVLLSLGFVFIDSQYSTWAGTIEQGVAIFFGGLLYGSILLLPVLLIFMLVVRLTRRKAELSIWKKKGIMQIITLVFSISPLVLLFNYSVETASNAVYGAALIAPYVVLFSFGIWFFEWKIEESEPLTIIDHLID